MIQNLKNLDDTTSWQDFYDTYWMFINAVAVKMGANVDLAEEITQEAFVRVAKKIQDFHRDPLSGKFRNWLATITKNIYIDLTRKASLNTIKLLDFAEEKGSPIDDQFKHIWDLEWIQNHSRIAMNRTRKRVLFKHFQVFYLLAFQEYSAKETSQLTGCNLPQVYVTRMRVAKVFKAEMELLKRRES